MERFVVAIVIGEIFDVVDDGDVEGAARAASDFLAELQIVLGDLKEVPAGARVRVRLKLLVPLHVFDLNVVVRHRFVSPLLLSLDFGNNQKEEHE